MASLFVVRGRDQGKHFPLDRDCTSIGRDAANRVQLIDHEASRMHAEIRHDAALGEFKLRDLRSSNGTIVNGAVVDEQTLGSGDRIEIGSTLLIFTGTTPPRAMDAAHGVDIVRQTDALNASRIVSALPSMAISRPAARESSRSSVATQGGTELSGSVHSFDTAVWGQDESKHEPAAEGRFDESSSAVGRSTESSVGPAGAGELDSDRSLEVMYLTALAVGRTGDLDEVLQRVLRLVFDWMDADRGCIMLREPATDQLRPAARCDRQSADRNEPSATISISRTILDYVIENKQGVRTSDAISDNRFDAAQSIVRGGVHEALCVPLQGRYDIVGCLYIDTYTPPGELLDSENAPKFTDDHLRLVTAIGHQAALAIEDTFYYSAMLQSERLAAMGQTIATLSHHIKNILQGIRGGSYLIDAGLKRDDTDTVKRGWKIVDRNQERISNLVLDMLTFSKERDPVRVQADLNDTVADVVELMQTQAADHSVTLGSDLAGVMPTAFFDPDAIHRAVMNVVTNAIDAAASASADAATSPPSQSRSSHDGDLRSVDAAASINAASPDLVSPEVASPEVARVFVQTGFNRKTGWYIDVVDNGLGIAPADREKIFSLFESKKGARGTGIGLPVTAKIMREHGGDVQVHDAPIGRGSLFRLTLPLDDREASD